MHVPLTHAQGGALHQDALLHAGEDTLRFVLDAAQTRARAQSRSATAMPRRRGDDARTARSDAGRSRRRTDRGSRPACRRPAHDDGPAQAFSTYGVVPADGAIDQTATLQEAADAAARTGTPLFLPAGTYSTARLTLKSGTHIHGVPGLTILRYASGGAILETEGTDNVRLTGLVLDGGGAALGENGALLSATEATHLDLSDCRFIGSSEDGVALRKVAGRVANCEIGDIAKAALFSEDAAGLEISHNHVHDCGDNGILVWRSEAGEDGTIVSGNRIERIAAKSGGSGQNGNGINVFRAGSVLVTQNRIADCAFSRDPLQFRLQLPDGGQFLRPARRGGALCRVLVSKAR